MVSLLRKSLLALCLLAMPCAAQVLGIANGGTGHSTQQSAFDALAPTSSVTGEYIYWNGSHWVSTSPGLQARGVGGTTSTDTILYSDASETVEYGGSVAVAVTLPTPTSLGNTYFSTVLDNYTSGSSTSVTVTPTTWTINGGSTLSILQGQRCFIKVNPNASTDWLASCSEGPITCSTGMTCTRTAAGLTLTSSGGGGSLSDYPDILYSVDKVPGSPGTLDDEFAGSSLSGSWTQALVSGATLTVSNSILAIKNPPHSGPNWSIVYQTAPATPWTVVAKCAVNTSLNTNWNAGLIVSDGTKIVDFGISGPYPNTPNTQLDGKNYSDANTYGGSGAVSAVASNLQAGYFKLQDDGTNLNYSFSVDGLSYFTVGSVADTNFFGSKPTKVGIGVDGENSSYGANIACWYFRRTQ